MVNYSARYGNWGTDYGNHGNWLLTKKRIACDIMDTAREYSKIDSEYFGRVRIPIWLMAEIQYYLSH